MALTPALVTVSRIQAPAGSPQDPARVERLAQAASQAGGVITPVILRRLDPVGIAYEVVGNHEVYWVAAKAKQLSPVDCEAVLAVILDNANEAGVLAQLAA